MVVAHNPGLANPEISKIIGEQWRSLSDDDKGKWRALAEVRYGSISGNGVSETDNFTRRKKLVISSNIPTTAISLGDMVGTGAPVTRVQVSVTIHLAHHIVIDVEVV